MAFLNQTGTFGLPIYEGTDKAEWNDTNVPFQALDAGVTAVQAKADTNANSITALQTAQGELANSVAEVQTAQATAHSEIVALQTVTSNHDTEITALNVTAGQLLEKTIKWNSYTNAAEAYTALRATAAELLPLAYAYCTQNVTISDARRYTRTETGAGSVSTYEAQFAFTAYGKFPTRVIHISDDQVIFEAAELSVDSTRQSTTNIQINLTATKASFAFNQTFAYQYNMTTGNSAGAVDNVSIVVYVPEYNRAD